MGHAPGAYEEKTLAPSLRRAGRQLPCAPEDPGLGCLSCPWCRKAVPLWQPTQGLEMSSSSITLPTPTSPPLCWCCGVCGSRAGRSDPWAHLVNVVDDFLHAILHCAQVLVFPELWEGHREISRLASTSSLQWMRGNTQAPSLPTTPCLPPRCPRPAPAPRIGDLCLMELISGREEESEHRGAQLCSSPSPVVDPLVGCVGSRGIFQHYSRLVGLLALLSDVTLLGVSDIFQHKEKPKPAIEA